MKTASAHNDIEMRGCVERADLFQNSLLEDPPTSMSADERRRASALRSEATRICAQCPLQNSCLYTAVVEHDVAGFVAGTSERERKQIRRRLGWKVERENLDSMAGAFAQNRPVDHDEIVRIRRANPHESLETLAHRMGCSLSTIKRHLRRHRLEQTEPRPKKTPIKPTLRRVMAAAGAKPMTRAA